MWQSYDFMNSMLKMNSISHHYTPTCWSMICPHKWTDCFSKLEKGQQCTKSSMSRDKTPRIVNDLICHSHVSFLLFPFLSSLPTTYQQHREKPRLSLFLFTQNGLQHLLSHSLGRERIHLLSGLQHSSVFFLLLVNAFKSFRATMVFVLFWICWLSKTSGYRVVSCGVPWRNR